MSTCRFGSAAPRFLRTWAGLTPGLAATSTASTRPGLPVSFWAVARSKIAVVAVPIALTEPNVARPVTLNGCAGPAPATRMVSPIPRCCFSAVPGSMTTWPGPSAHAPLVRRNGVRPFAVRAALSRPTPNHGPEPTSSPLAPRILASVDVMSPAAAATPGTRRTRSTTDAGIAGCWSMSLLSRLTGVFASTTAAVPS